MKQRYSKPIDAYEKSLDAFLNAETFVEMPKEKFKKHSSELQLAAKEYIAKKSITLRVRNDDLNDLKAKAKKASIPYQTLLNILIGQYAKGKIKLAI